jgi:hypothetical protein
MVSGCRYWQPNVQSDFGCLQRGGYKGAIAGDEFWHWL